MPDILVSGALIAWDIRDLIPDFSERIRHAYFQVSSIMTTTGFSTVDFDVWPAFSKAILLCLMAVGACAGSTGGGLKVIRLSLMLKSLRRAMRRTLRPNSVQLVRVNGKVVEDDVLHNVSAYLVAYVLILFGSFVVVSLDELSLESNISAVFSCFNNIGPGFDAVGPMVNYDCYRARNRRAIQASRSPLSAGRNSTVSTWSEMALHRCFMVRSGL